MLIRDLFYAIWIRCYGNSWMYVITMLLFFIYYMSCLSLHGSVRLMYPNSLWIIKKKGSLSEHENRNFKIRLDCFGQSNFASLYSNFHICNLLSLYRPCFLSETKKRFLYTQWIHIFMLEELETHGWCLNVA